MRILVADDEPVMLQTIEHRLKNDGHEVIVTDNGREAMELIDRMNPDLIITDIMMPYSSGLEIVSRLRSADKRNPVIVLSCQGEENVVIEAFQLGADDYITKPFNTNELSLRVKRFFC